MTKVCQHLGWVGVVCLVVISIVIARCVPMRRRSRSRPTLPTINYRSAQDTGVARAFCLEGEKLTGGGAFVEAASGLGSDPVQLRQSYPISDPSGVIAFGENAIGWQAASSNFEDTVVAFAICASVP